LFGTPFKVGTCSFCRRMFFFILFYVFGFISQIIDNALLEGNPMHHGFDSNLFAVYAIFMLFPLSLLQVHGWTFVTVVEGGLLVAFLFVTGSRFIWRRRWSVVVALGNKIMHMLNGNIFGKMFFWFVLFFALAAPLAVIELTMERRHKGSAEALIPNIKYLIKTIWSFFANSRFALPMGVLLFVLSPVLLLVLGFFSYGYLLWGVFKEEKRYQASLKRGFRRRGFGEIRPKESLINPVSLLARSATDENGDNADLPTREPEAEGEGLDEPFSPPSPSAQVHQGLGGHGFDLESEGAPFSSFT